MSLHQIRTATANVLAYSMCVSSSFFCAWNAPSLLLSDSLEKRLDGSAPSTVEYIGAAILGGVSGMILSAIPICVGMRYLEMRKYIGRI